MKRIYTLLFFFVLVSWSNPGQAQQNSELLSKADELYYQEAYRPAARLYKKIYKKSKNEEASQEVLMKLAGCYVEIYNYGAAYKWYKKIYKDRQRLKQVADSLYCDERKFEVAMQMYATLRSRSKEKQGYDLQVARSYFAIRKDLKAIEWYSKVISEEELESYLANDSILNKVALDDRHIECWEYSGVAAPDLPEAYSYQRIVKPSDYLHLAQAMLNIRGKYHESKKWFQHYSKLQKLIEMQNENLLISQTTYYIDSLPINSSVSDFSPAFYKDSLVFVSERDIDGSKVSSINGEERSPLDLYIVKLDSAGQGQGIRKLINKDRNVTYNEGPVAFLDHGRKMIFTGNTFDERKLFKQNNPRLSNININRIQLFSANQSGDNTWEVNPIHFLSNDSVYNNLRYSKGHPALTANGKRLFFAADYPGGFGGSDLYYSDYDGQAKRWTEPVNLGEKVNTEGNEVFPYIHTDRLGNQSLFFASNRPGGFGGLDIYQSLIVGNEYTNPVNLGDTSLSGENNSINSSKDDFGLILDKDGVKGYFSSDRSGDDDIYQFKIVKIQVTVCDSENGGAPLPGAEVAFHKGDQAELLGSKTAEDGVVWFHKFALGGDYSFMASAPGYRPKWSSMETFSLDQVPADGIYRVKICLEPRAVADMIVLANVKSEQQCLISFNKDVYELTETPLKSNTLYELVQKGALNYFINTEQPDKMFLANLDEVIDISGMENPAKRTQLVNLLDEANIGQGEVTVIRNIRYNFAAPDPQKFPNLPAFVQKLVKPEDELTKVAKVMEIYPHLDLKMSSHTDRCPLDGNYDNLALSGRRNQAAVDYIVKLFTQIGSSEEELELLKIRMKKCQYTYEYPVDTETTYDGCKNDFNRRTEFKFLYKHRDNYGLDCDCDPSVIQYIRSDDSQSKR
ncbi:hypothetical protein AAG747_15790 [Rapidithrix thailandica]|uniref:WD40 repeat protein n=1 Tax=Rapidithrix thailandica TaxID=413964 RepID=A0AAW9SEV5_9BACT